MPSDLPAAASAHLRAADRADRAGRRTPRVAAAALLGILVALTGCAASGPVPAPSTSAVPPTPTPSPTPTPTPTPTADPLAGLDLGQRVGQVFMVGTDVSSATADTLAAVTDRHAGSIFLHGRTSGGADGVAAVVGQFTALVGGVSGPTGGVPLWVATDQEGGEVQVLQGPGFDDIPYAIRQADLSDDQLRASATTWGRQLAAVGVTMNLAPVADIVTSAATRFDNPPIGGYGRQYGYDAPTVTAKAGAFADGMRAAGVLPTFKHFPGLGHVTANTDDTADVVDTTVTADGPDVSLYRPLTQSGPSAVMVSSAIYQNIDPSTPAVFSPTVVRLVRDEVGFDGVVMTDDVSAAVAVQAWSPADRAIDALTAGVDLILVSADPTVFAEMYDAVLAKAQADPSFAALVDAAAARIVAAKHPG
ncbi:MULTISPECIES: glycoside hydrolase family 3 N-terminal domain-containing protein [unclassified Microbacterium]|uniref:glycoside hydrolase family 3 N-terminal domain-containing protein n=1 Tax=unclassified Microbacterium TaxID=2609290 RepID=UPI0030167FAE